MTDRPPTDPQPAADRSHRTVLAVTVTSRPDGGHYIDQADFTAHVAQWLKTDLKGHHAIDQVTVDDQADDAHRLTLSDALGLGTSAPWDAIRERAAELAGQDAAGDRGAVLREEAARIRAHCPDHLDSNSADGAWISCHCDVADDMLRRLAAEGQRCPHGCDTSTCPRLACEAEQADDPGGALIEEYLRFLRGQGPEPDLSDLPQQQREAFAGQFEIVKALFDRGPELPPLDRDPVARRLGLYVPVAGTPQPGTQATPRRGDEFEQWLKAQRDEYQVESSPQWGALDEVLDTYRLHADTGTPLGEHVCEGRVAGDCDCLETPATETPDAPRREPHPTEADLRHALAVLDRFEGRDAAEPVEPAASHATEYRHTCHDQTSAPGRDYDCQWCSTLPESLPAVVAEPGKEN